VSSACDKHARAGGAPRRRPCRFPFPWRGPRAGGAVGPGRMRRALRATRAAGDWLRALVRRPRGGQAAGLDALLSLDACGCSSQQGVAWSSASAGTQRQRAVPTQWQRSARRGRRAAPTPLRMMQLPRCQGIRGGTFPGQHVLRAPKPAKKLKKKLTSILFDKREKSLPEQCYK
jgi:hypothetical protein